MSAWIVSNDHIDLLLTAAIAWDLATPGQADEIGQMLWKENLQSVAHRYPRDRNGDRPGPHGFRDEHTDGYRFQIYPGRVDPQATASAARSLEYQSCEHSGWSASRAREWVLRLKDEAAARTSSYVAEHGPVDVKRQPAHQAGWYYSTDENGRHLVCGHGWDVADREVFIRAALLRITPAAPSTAPEHRPATSLLTETTESPLHQSQPLMEVRD